jgi:hypothetical protein
MTYRISHCRYLAGATATAALIISASAATAQTAQPQTEAQARILSGMGEAVKSMDNNRRLRKLSPEKKRQLVQFVTGNTMFVMAHELGHGLINEMSLPVLGREEDAADSFAIVTALNMESDYTDRVVIEAAKGWVLSAKRDKKEKNALAFYDEHGLDLQRAYNVVCFLVGADPEKYQSLAAETELPEERQASCAYDWKNTSWSWGQMLEKHRRSADQPKTTITVEYHDEDKYPMQSRILRQMGLLEAFAAHAADRYAWPKPFSIIARSCGEPDARWKSRTLTLCYELADEFVELYLDYSRKLPRKARAKR